MTNTNAQSEVLPVFRLKPRSDGNALCQYIGTIDKTEQLTDETIEFAFTGSANNSVNNDKIINKYTFSVMQHGSYEVSARSCVCNISGSYLIKNTKLPIYYVTLLYEKQFVSGQLFTLFVYFTIDDETQKKLVSPKHYVNRMMSGKYTMELVSDESFLSFMVDRKRKEFAEQEPTLTNEHIEEKLNEYRKFFEPEEILFPTRSLLMNKFASLAENKLFKEMVIAGLDQREIDRKKKSAPDQSFKPPKNIIDLKNLKNDPDMEKKIDDIVNNLSDLSDESDESDDE